jgi:hypothetical protein
MQGQHSHGTTYYRRGRRLDRRSPGRTPARTGPKTEPVPDEVGRLTTEQILAIVDELGDMITALRDAEPEHKLEVYRNLGLRLTYNPATQTVRAEIDLATHRRDSVRVRGRTRTETQRGHHLTGTIRLA